MSFLGNIIWLILGGIITSLLYILAGLIMCITIIGIPLGFQLIKIGFFALHPFGREPGFETGQPGCLALVGNIIWIMIGWWEIAVLHLIFAAILCITIVGIPLGLQHLKLARMSLFPFGTSSIRK